MNQLDHRAHEHLKAAVTLRSISNFISDEGTRDGAYGPPAILAETFTRTTTMYWKYSPIRYAGNVKTPTLVLHSETILRVPLEQGEQWFARCSISVVTSEFVIFQREKSQPDAYWRTEAFGRKSQLAELLVRSLPQRKRVGKAAHRVTQRDLVAGNRVYNSL
jgi:hypothetical protein